MRFTKLILLFLLVLSLTSNAQIPKDSKKIRLPIDLPIFLSGTFGEPRTNHFHSGIDIRTASKSGYKIYAIEDGFVSRIAVSPGGFGKAIYIDHPDGHTSVYAHLQQFEGEIATYVKKQQYKLESFEVNLSPDKSLIPIIKGQVIALSGNSGSSEGPHLHFEIRDTKSQEILNPIDFGIGIKDDIRPNISRLVLYPIGNQSIANDSPKRSMIGVMEVKENEKPAKPIVVEASGELAFGISTSDRMNDVPNTNGVQSVTLLIDRNIFWQIQADRFSFDETRYINSLIDYEFFITYKSRVIRTEIDPLNKLSIYEKSTNKGILKLEEGKTYQAEYIVTDFKGNKSYLPFTIKGVAVKSRVNTVKSDSAVWKITAGKAEETRNNRFFIRFAEKSFYRDQSLTVLSTIEKGFLSAVLKISPVEIPVHQSYSIGLKPDQDNIKHEKLVIVRLEKNEKPSSVGGKWEDGYIVAQVRSMGNFALLADSIAPKIKPVNFNNGKVVHTLKNLQLEISDDLSGISSYRGTLNGEWILMDYDAKNSLLSYSFDEKIRKGKNKLTVKVTDACGNQSLINADLIY